VAAAYGTPGASYLLSKRPTVPEASVEGLRQLARAFRDRMGMAGVTGAWRRLGLSAELLVDPRSGARCAIRDTAASGAARYYWTVNVFGDHRVAAGRMGRLARLDLSSRRRWLPTWEILGSS